MYFGKHTLFHKKEKGGNECERKTEDVLREVDGGLADVGEGVVTRGAAEGRRSVEHLVHQNT